MTDAPKSYKPVGSDWFLLDKAPDDEVIESIVKEVGVRVVSNTAPTVNVTVHRTHLPLLFSEEPEPFQSFTVPGQHQYNDPPDWWFDELFSYQCIDADWMADRRSSILAADLGLGKTRTGIAAGLAPYLILCPKSAVSVWEDEFEYAGLTCRVLSGYSPDSIQDVKAVLHEGDLPDAWIVGYHVASHWLPYFCEGGVAPARIHTLIADEAHYLQRTRLSWAKAYCRVAAEQFILMTATPIRNKLKSLWPLLNAIAPAAWGPHYAWRRQYCAATDGDYGLVDGTPTQETLERLQKRLSAVLIKRTRADVKQHLPSLERRAHPVQLPDAVISDVIRRCALAAHENSSGSHLAWATKMRQEFGLLKVPTAVNFVRDLLIGTKQYAYNYSLDCGWSRVVLWVWHDAVAKELTKQLKDQFGKQIEIESLLGRTQQKKRDAIAREWKKGDTHPEKPKVLIASIAAASTAISLTSCGVCIFVEQDWAPLQMQQAEARTHRFGQKNPKCLAIYLTVPGTIDEQMAEVLLAKAEEAESVLGKDGQVDQMKVMLGGRTEETESEFMRRMAANIIDKT